MKYSIYLAILLFAYSCKCTKSAFIPPCDFSTVNKPLRSLEVGQRDTVCIYAINPQNHTAILLVKNAEYTMEVIPATQTWKDGWLKPFTANGRISPHFTFLHLFKRKICAKWFALIGSVDDKRSTYFKIGTKKDLYKADRNGELVCFANDVYGDYWYCHNNEGVLTMVVTRIK